MELGTRQPDVGDGGRACTGGDTAACGLELPQLELASYAPIEVKLPVVEVTDEMVRQNMERLAWERGSDYTPIGRGVVLAGDILDLDVEIADEGGVVPQLSKTARTHVLGIGAMPTGFDDALVGATVGEELAFDFSAPVFGLDPAAAESKRFHARVTVNTVLEKRKPALSDEWVATYLKPYADMAAFEADVRAELASYVQGATEEQRERLCMDELGRRLVGDLPNEWLEKTIHELYEAMRSGAEAEGKSIDTLLAENGGTKSQLSQMLITQARSVLTQGFALDAWARHYGIEPDEADLVAYAGALGAGDGVSIVRGWRAGDDIARLDNLRLNARRLKAKRHVLETACG